MEAIALTTRLETAKNYLEKFFSDGSLSEKMQQALELTDIPSLNIFITQVPWRIVLSDGGSVGGLSENMRFAAKDIHANLVYLARKLSPQSTIRIEIDESRLLAIQIGRSLEIDESN